MADNVTVDNGTGTDYGVAADKVTYSGDADQTVQLVRVVGVTGSEGSKTVSDLNTAGGLDVSIIGGGGNVETETGGNATDAFNVSGYPGLIVHDFPHVYNGSTWDRLRGNTAGTFQQGNVAHDAADSGNPVKIGGKADTAFPAAVTDGDRVDALFDEYGRLAVTTGDSASDANDAGDNGVTSGMTTHGSGGLAYPLGVRPQLFNGTTWDRMRGNTLGLFTGPQHTAISAVTLDVLNEALTVDAQGIETVTFRIVISGTSTLTLLVEGYDGSTWSGAKGYDTYGPAQLELALVGGSGSAIWHVPTAGFTQLRMRVSAYTSGSASVSAVKTASPHPSPGRTMYAVDDSSFEPTQILASAETLALNVGGDVAHDTADAGNPLKIGGKASATAPTAVAAGDRVDGWFGTNGAQVAATASSTTGSTGNDASAQGARLAPNGATALAMPSAGYVYNPTGDVWDRMRGDTTGTYMVGNIANDTADSGNPVKIGARASSTIPTAVTTGDRVNAWANLNGAQIVSTAPHIGLNSDPWNLVHEAAQYTSAQTSTVLVAGGASEKIVVTKVQIQSYGTTAGTCVLYFGTGAYSRGTNRAIFDGEFAPSATLKPGVVMDGPFIAGTNGDDVLVTTTNAQSVTISIWYYVIT